MWTVHFRIQPFLLFHDPEKLNNETSYEKTLLGLSQDISFLLEEFHELKQDIKISISGNKAKLEDIDEQMKENDALYKWKLDKILDYSYDIKWAVEISGVTCN